MTSLKTLPTVTAALTAKTAPTPASKPAEAKVLRFDAKATAKLETAAGRLDSFETSKAGLGKLAGGNAPDFPGAPGATPPPPGLDAGALRAATGAQLAQAGISPELANRYFGRDASAGALGAGSPPAGPDVPGVEVQGNPPLDPFAGLAASNTTMNPMSFSSASQLRASLAGADSGGGSTQSSSSSTDRTDSKGGQHIEQTDTTKNPDGSVDTSKQTHDSDGKGNLKETQDVSHTDKNGNTVREHHEHRENADGSSSDFRSTSKSKSTSTTPRPDGEDRAPLSSAEVQAAIARKKSGLVDPPDENGRAEVAAGRLAAGVAVMVMSKVNPNPDAPAREQGPISPKPSGIGGGDPVDENHTGRPGAPLRPQRPEPVPGTGGPRGPRVG